MPQVMSKICSGFVKIWFSNYKTIASTAFSLFSLVNLKHTVFQSVSDYFQFLSIWVLKNKCQIYKLDKNETPRLRVSKKGLVNQLWN